MSYFSEYQFLAAALLARAFLGFLFLFQGIDAVFGIGVPNVISTYKGMFTNRKVPSFLIVLASWFTSYTELIGGILLVLGLFEYVALYLVALNLLVAAIGFGLNTPVWDTRFVLPRLILILFLLCIPHEWHQWSLDHLMFKP